MRVKAVEIRWHNTQPIFSCDFQPLPYKTPDQIRQQNQDNSENSSNKPNDEEQSVAAQGWRLATAGADNSVRLWLVHNRNHPSKAGTKLSLSNVEYLASLNKHSAVVNVVRWSPSGEMLASAGDDGCIILWVLSDKPAGAQFGESLEDRAYERETWRIQKMLRASSGEVYDLAWSPDGEYIIAGSTDNTARIFSAVNGQLLRQIAEHSNYVQGVAWDPLGKYLATQSSDRHMHVYGYEVLQRQSGTSEIQLQLVGKNNRINVDHSATYNWATTSSEPSAAESCAIADNDDDGNNNNNNTATTASTSTSSISAPSVATPPSTTSLPPPPPPISDQQHTTQHQHQQQQQQQQRPPSAKRTHSFASRESDSDKSDYNIPPLPLNKPSSSSATSIPSGSPITAAVNSSNNNKDNPSSRRSSFSNATATIHSPLPSPQHTIYSARSPSPVPPLPAIRTPLSPKTSSNIPLYGGQEVSPFFRRLCWSTDGSLLLTPAGLFEDPFIPATPSSVASDSRPPQKKKRLETENEQTSSSSSTTTTTTKSEKQQQSSSPNVNKQHKPTAYIYPRGNLGNGPIAHLPVHRTNSVAIRFCPVLWEKRRLPDEHAKTSLGKTSQAPVQIHMEERGQEKVVTLPTSSSSNNENNTDQDSSLEQSNTKAETQTTPTTNNEDNKHNEDEPSAFDLPYRMIYVIVTHDTAIIYDTQQSTPICVLANLHYAPFTDITWSVDGTTLVLASQDGYCSLVSFDQNELGTRYYKQIKPSNVHLHHHIPPQLYAHHQQYHQQDPSKSASSSSTSTTVKPSHSRNPSASLMPTPNSDNESSSLQIENKPPVINQLQPKKKKRPATDE